MASRSIPLDKPLSIDKMLSGEGFTFQVNFEDYNADEDDADLDDDCVPKLESDIAELNVEDEDTYAANPTLFDDLLPLMSKVDDKGQIMKRIFRGGKGDLPSEKSKVNFSYKAYLEINPEPFDSTYNRKRPHICKLGAGMLLPGLEAAVASMKMNERSQFIIDPELAYGKLGIPQFVPPMSKILFEVELKSFADVADSDDEDDNMKKIKFEPNFNQALKLCEEANFLVSNERKYRPAIRLYNEAINKLSQVLVNNELESEKFTKLLVRLHTNLAVSHMHLDHFKKCCINCQEVYKLCKLYEIPVPDKIYYNHAKALHGLGEIDRAYSMLRTVAVNNYGDGTLDLNVQKLFKKLLQSKEERKKMEKDIAKGMFTSASAVVIDEFKEVVRSYCTELKNDSEKKEVFLPDKLNEHEIEFVRQTAKDSKLQLIHEKSGDTIKYIIKKL